MDWETGKELIKIMQYWAKEEDLSMVGQVNYRLYQLVKEARENEKEDEKKKG